MLVAELVDTIWATRKSEALNGVKFLLAEVKGGRRSGELLVSDSLKGGQNKCRN